MQSDLWRRVWFVFTTAGLSSGWSLPAMLRPPPNSEKIQSLKTILTVPQVQAMVQWKVSDPEDLLKPWTVAVQRWL